MMTFIMYVAVTLVAIALSLQFFKWLRRRQRDARWAEYCASEICNCDKCWAEMPIVDDEYLFDGESFRLVEEPDSARTEPLPDPIQKVEAAKKTRTRVKTAVAKKTPKKTAKKTAKKTPKRKVTRE